MFRKNVFVVIFLLISVFAFSQTQTISRPKLVVGIVVDQMRWDYLYRYYDRYGNGGFKRLLSDGFSCENTFINYLPSYTAVGHSTIYTGSVPSIHGIAGNDWIEQLTGKHMYCTEDTTVESVGVPNSMEGQMSPKNLLVTTVTDELRIATNYQSKVVGVSLKDRAAILPAGHAANAAFWLDDASGHFITSTYYMKELPDWVNQFNKQNKIEQYIKDGWNTLYPINTYVQSDSDNKIYEGKLAGESASVFPHNIKKAYEKSKGFFRPTPFGNSFTLEFATAAIDGYQLGKGPAADFLTINCASTDYVGHTFGPNSIEVEDTYLRLDQDLAKFFSMLDAKIGKDQYIVFLTADHGAAHAIGYSQQNKMPGDFYVSQIILDNLNRLLAAKFGEEKLILAGMNYQIIFDMKKINDKKLDFDAIKKSVVDYLQQQPGVNYALDVAKIGEAPIPEPIKTMIINGYNLKRSGPVQVAFNAGWLESYARTGTTHGSWNPYDTHIPLVFMGWGIRQGSSNSTLHMTDIAPTIAALLHIQMPSGCIGMPIREVMK
ncbi:MAG: alkaline phosphatase family protein [Bacteroidetes bacterium]|nr:alkaline phosphatase family protein [Bacteroidota bacterium]